MPTYKPPEPPRRGPQPPKPGGGRDPRPLNSPSERGEVRSPRNPRGERGPRPTLKGVTSTTELKAQTQQSLRDFFQQPLVSKIASVLIPGALAAFLFPVFGTVVAAGAVGVAVQNSLKLLGISFSSETAEKLLKGEQLKGSDAREILEDNLKKLLPEDEQVNKDATRVLIVIIPQIRKAALAGPDRGLEQLRRSLEASLEKQGGTMARMASQLSTLIELIGNQLEVESQRLMVEVNGH